MAVRRTIICLEQVELRDAGTVVALISPGLVATDGLAAAGAAMAAGRANAPQPPPDPSLRPLTVATSVAAMASVIAGLDGTCDGRHLDLRGNVVPW